MSASLVRIKAVESVNLVFGLEWFAILGGTVRREVRRIVRQQKATHAVHGGDGVVSVGVTSLASRKRSTDLYSAAQLVAQRFSTGAVAVIMQLDPKQWWLVAVHEGAVIARTDYVCDSPEEALERVAQLRHAYPNLTVLNDEKGQLSLSDLVNTLHAEAQLRRVVYGHRRLSRPHYVWALLIVVFYVLYRSGFVADVLGWRDAPPTSDFSVEHAWAEALRDLAEAHWVHGVAGSASVLLSLYALPVQLEGWRLHRAECIASKNQWHCHADYGRDDPGTSNERFLKAAQASWDISFTPLEQARVRWGLTAAGHDMAHTALHSAQYIERSLFSALQAIRPAFTLMTIDAPQRLSVAAPLDEHGHVLPQPSGWSEYRTRAVRIQAPLRSISLLLPHSRSMNWQRVALSVEPHVQPDLTHSRVNIILQGALYEQD